MWWCCFRRPKKISRERNVTLTAWNVCVCIFTRPHNFYWILIYFRSYWMLHKFNFKGRSTQSSFRYLSTSFPVTQMCQKEERRGIFQLNFHISKIILTSPLFRKYVNNHADDQMFYVWCNLASIGVCNLDNLTFEIHHL